MSSNAAIYFHPGGFDTSGPNLLGRLSAGESFLRGYLRHADVDQYFLWNVAGQPQETLEQLLERIEPPSKPITWIGQSDRRALGQAGVLNTPVPSLADEAWQRLPVGASRYAVCGITHTTATQRIMDVVGDMLVAPTESYDALICTSEAVRHSIEVQLTLMREYLAQELGSRRRAEPMRVTIPLGVNVDDFTTSPEQRASWREKLGIPADAVVALFMGRFDVRGKMNPALMALALEKAAQATDKSVYWVNAGWAKSEEAETEYHSHTRSLCPSVHYLNVDGRPLDVRFSIWSVADFFISFSDNIQETFGLTPVEAMAAGLPCVVTDWDGYKDTVRHGIDGFRIPTLAPPPGYGADIAYWYETALMSYDNYLGATSQFTAIDYGAARDAIVALIENADLRAELGRNARERARSVFDWSAVIPQYQALWGEQNARRRAAHPQKVAGNPYRPDPFTLFQSYPSQHLSREFRIMPAPGMDAPVGRTLLSHPLAAYSRFNRPSLDDVDQIVVWVSANPGKSVAELLQLFPSPKQSLIERGLLWLARYDVIRLQPPA